MTCWVPTASCRVPRSSLVSLERRNERLKTALQAVAADYDFVLIDCPPSLSMLTLNGLCSAHGVIVPMQCEYFALEGLTDLVNTIKQVHANMNPDLQIIGLLRVMFDPRTTLQQQVSDHQGAFRRQGVRYRDPAQCAPGRGPQLRPARRGVRRLGQGQQGLCRVCRRDGATHQENVSVSRETAPRPHPAIANDHDL